jgi:hypothetical protein
MKLGDDRKSVYLMDYDACRLTPPPLLHGSLVLVGHAREAMDSVFMGLVHLTPHTRHFSFPIPPCTKSLREDNNGLSVSRCTVNKYFCARATIDLLLA